MRMFLLPRMSDQMQLSQVSPLILPPSYPMSHSSAVAVYGDNVGLGLSMYVPTRRCEYHIVWTHNELQDPVTGISGKTEYKGLKAVIWTLCQKLLKK